MRFIGIVKKREKKITYAFALICAFMMYLEIVRHQWIYIPVIALVIVACFFEKDHVISEEGIVIEYRVFGLTSKNLWKWEEITSMHFDYKKAFPNCMIHIGKDIVTRTFVYNREVCADIVALAKKMNPKIYIEEQ